MRGYPRQWHMCITFALLACAIASVWWPKTCPGGKGMVAPWMVLFAAAMVAGCFAGVLTTPAVIALLVMAGICLKAASLGARRQAGGWTWAAGGFGLALALHALPGFHNPMLVNAVRITPGALPFTLYANFDKGSVGLLILACFAPRLASLKDARAVVVPTLVAIVVTGAASIGAAWLAGYVRFEPKLGVLPSFAPVFLFVNLFFTCVAEEVFFRGLIQERLTRGLAHRPRLVVLPVIVSASLFGLAHLGGGPVYMAAATLAGLGYAGVYAKTRRVEAAVVTHFAVNAMHFIFFTYPGLVR